MVRGVSEHVDGALEDSRRNLVGIDSVVELALKVFKLLFEKTLSCL